MHADIQTVACFQLDTDLFSTNKAIGNLQMSSLSVGWVRIPKLIIRRSYILSLQVKHEMWQDD